MVPVEIVGIVEGQYKLIETWEPESTGKVTPELPHIRVRNLLRGLRETLSCASQCAWGETPELPSARVCSTADAHKLVRGPSGQDPPAPSAKNSH